MKNAGITVSIQPTHLFHGKVSGSAIERYNDLHPKDRIVPDILAHNFPFRNSGIGAMTTTAIFDVKTLRIDKAGTFYPQNPNRMHVRAVDKKIGGVRRDYMRRAEGLDRTCTNNDGTTPFQVH